MSQMTRASSRVQHKSLEIDRACGAVPAYLSAECTEYLPCSACLDKMRDIELNPILIAQGAANLGSRNGSAAESCSPENGLPIVIAAVRLVRGFGDQTFSWTELALVRKVSVRGAGLDRNIYILKYPMS
jgi:hypothetical protein